METVQVPERVSSSIKQSNKVIRSKDHGCFRMFQSAAWGRYLVPIDDPDGQKLTKFERDGIKLNDGFSLIPPDLWSRYISLCFYMCPESKKISTSLHDSQLEVQVCLLRDEETLTKWKIVVPKQIVSGVSVKSDLTSNIDIVTGERYTQFPPPGWLHAGSSHSHNTMDSFFSTTDDKSELTVPGLHIVVGNIDHEKGEYTYKASVVLQKLRKDVDIDNVVDTAPGKHEFHKDVLEYINTVVTANKKLYLKLGKKEEKKSPLTDAASDVPMFDDNGDPTSFMNSLNRSNSDLFDDDPYLFPEMFIDEEIAATVDEWIEQGIPPEVIHQSVDFVTGRWGSLKIISDLDKD